MSRFVRRDEFARRVDLRNQKELKLMRKLSIPRTEEVRTNPYSKESATLYPEAAALYDFIMQNNGYGGFPGFDEAVAIFRRNWTKEYMTLLD